MFIFISELAPRIFYKLQNLKDLNLSGNRLQHIDGQIFVDIPNLEVFSCSKCSLVQVNQFFCKIFFKRFNVRIKFNLSRNQPCYLNMF